ncbi:hypothetical protein MLD38_029655 [Melastoma candidum]|uniref:Uncharacterized protein n=1 Tax=Melastoma candidum TaxID=119954 RepID=A0ACB9N4D5_9MYRT|nr:hypothetical protein MLD38_029655 [Melastoma candidum]
MAKDYPICINKVTSAVIEKTASHGFSYTVMNSFGIAHAGKCYAHGPCNGILHQDECTDCLKQAVASTGDYCANRIGAQTKLQDCRFRYENYLFDTDG